MKIGTPVREKLAPHAQGKVIEFWPSAHAQWVTVWSEDYGTFQAPTDTLEVVE